MVKAERQEQYLKEANQIKVNRDDSIRVLVDWAYKPIPTSNLLIIN